MEEEHKNKLAEKFHFGFDNQGPYCLECGSHNVFCRAGMYVNHYYCQNCGVDSIG